MYTNNKNLIIFELRKKNLKKHLQECDATFCELLTFHLQVCVRITFSHITLEVKINGKPFKNRGEIVIK